MKKYFSLLLLLPIALKAQKNYPALLDSFMQSAVTVNKFNGSVLVAKSGKVIYQKNFGFKNLESDELLNDNSMFELGVVTEQFTSVGILLLYQQKKLNLDDPITKYFPQLPYKNVTIKHLLTHTSGLPDYYEMMAGKWKAGEYATNADIIAFLTREKAPLLSEPGTKFAEQDFTAAPLLASVIEKLSGRHYADYMREEVFVPLHMQHTMVLAGLHTGKAQNTDMTTGTPFDFESNAYMPSDAYAAKHYKDMYYIIDNILGGVCISSTAGDLLLWDRALKNNALLKAAVAKEMFSPHVLKDTLQKVYYGYGTWVGRNELGKYIISQDGGNAALGYSTSITRYPDKDITIIVLCNKHKNRSQVSGTLAYIMFDKDVEPLREHKEMTVTGSVLDRYAGKYSGDLIFELVRKDESIYMRFGGEPDLKMLSESPTRLFSSSGDYDFQLEFETDNSGKVIKAFLIARGIRKEIKKIN